MSRPGLIVLLLFVALLPIGAAAMEPAFMCRDAAATAERNWTLPLDLIDAIGRVESGRFDRIKGGVLAWPWTVNADGSGSWFASRAAAVAFVRDLQSRGVRLIDVGCFQVDLFYHPTAFSSLEQAFEPDANADYAARFLTALHSRTGSWPAAIAGYHSGLAPKGETYRRKVMAQWRSDGVLAGSLTRSVAVGIGRQQLKQDLYVVLMSAAARAIPVIGP